jgi:hypothetical protein
MKFQKEFNKVILDIDEFLDIHEGVDKIIFLENILNYIQRELNNLKPISTS